MELDCRDNAQTCKHQLNTDIFHADCIVVELGILPKFYSNFFLISVSKRFPSLPQTSATLGMPYFAAFTLSSLECCYFATSELKKIQARFPYKYLFMCEVSCYETTLDSVLCSEVKKLTKWIYGTALNVRQQPVQSWQMTTEKLGTFYIHV